MIILSIIIMFLHLCASVNVADLRAQTFSLIAPVLSPHRAGFRAVVTDEEAWSGARLYVTRADVRKCRGWFFLVYFMQLVFVLEGQTPGDFHQLAERGVSGIPRL